MKDERLQEFRPREFRCALDKFALAGSGFDAIFEKLLNPYTQLFDCHFHHVSPLPIEQQNAQNDESLQFRCT